jgi:septal ring factor EnvC (AmiA/AmiB activator)
MRATQRSAPRADTTGGSFRRNAVAKPKNLVLAVLIDIREEIKRTNERLESVDGRLRTVETSVGHLTTEVAGLGGAMHELAQQQQFVVSGLRALSTRDHRFDAELAELRLRIDALEARDRPRR